MTWLPKRIVVVPIDFSDFSFAALGTALELVETPNHILIVHVLADLSATETGELWRTIDTDARKRHARQALEEKLAERKLQSIPIEISLGEPGHAIAQIAQDKNAELIVLPSHGRTGIKRLLIGSVAERVVRYAHCPVLVLRH